MLEHKKIRSLDDYFADLNGRQSREVYFYRINGYSEEVGAFIKKYYDAARKTGVVIEGKIPNPDEGNLSYYNEIILSGFRLIWRTASTNAFPIMTRPPSCCR